MVSVQLIETEFGYAGHWLKQIWRQGDVAVYERSVRKDRAPHELELVIIKMRPERFMPNGDFVAVHEAYSQPSEWGTSGWSFPVRYREWVLGLAGKLAGILKARPSFVRQASNEFKASDALAPFQAALSGKP
jgi:hypothetical protein